MKKGRTRGFKRGKFLSSGMATAFLLSVILLFSQAQPAMSAEEDLYSANWTKLPTTPILSPGAPGSWDKTGVGVSCVIEDGGTYKMWYTGYDENDLLQIGYATSDAGTTWTKFSNNTGGPVLTPGGAGTWDEKGVGSARVIKVGTNDYRMWYTGYKEELNGDLTPQIGYATSEDGETWTKYDNDTGGPVLEPGIGEAWDNKGVHSGWVMGTGSNFKMWYTGRTGESVIGDSEIGYATSTDGGITWIKDQDTGGPVLTRGSGGAWDESGVSVSSVLTDGSKYYMYYSGYSGTAQNEIVVAIGFAQSDDGITGWSKNTYPVLEKEDAGWNSGGAGAPCVIEKSATELVIYYTGLSSELASQVGRAYIKSTQINGTVKLEGGERPDPAGYAVPLTLKLYHPSLTLNSANILNDTLQMFKYTQDAGDITLTPDHPYVLDFSVTVPSGEYQLSLVTEHCLVNLKDVVLTSPTTSVDMGTLLEGNANDNNQLIGDDFVLLLNDYLMTDEGAKWNDGRCDFDRSGQVDSVDFSLLVKNYNMFSPQNL